MTDRQDNSENTISETIRFPKQPTLSLSNEDTQRLAQFIAQSRQDSMNYLGYPAAKDLDISALYECLTMPINNLGDPFAKGTWKVDSHEFEREVLAFFADILRAPKQDWWGYVTNGGTEGNLYGLYLARELHPDGIVYFSQDTHYSVSKNIHFLNMRHIMIRSQPSGEIDYDDLRETLTIHRDKPPIIFANIGTTMTEAKDDIRKIRHIIEELAIPDVYVHSDAAMSGMIAPFLSEPPAFDFADGADSISISGHKFLGSPIPAGIVMARKSAVNRIARSIAYIGNLDTTVTGSRNGFSPLIIWQKIRMLGKSGFKQRVDDALKTAEYALQQLQQGGIQAWRLKDAITVVFPTPSEALIHKWQLASSHGITHMILVPGVDKAIVDACIQDLVEDHRQRQEQKDSTTEHRDSSNYSANESSKQESTDTTQAIKQITVVMRKSDQSSKQSISNITRLLADHEINIDDIDTFLDPKNTYLHLILSDTDRGLSLLTNHGYQVISEDTVLVQVPDKLGALAEISRLLAANDIELRGISHLDKSGGGGTVSLSCSDHHKARELLREHLLN